MMFSPTCCYRFEEGKWFQADCKIDMRTTTKSAMPSSLRIAQYNVLYPAAEFLTRPHERYAHQFGSLFPNLSPDVICLNEASGMYLSTMQQTGWVRKGYISHLVATSGTEHEVMIYSRLPFRCYRVQSSDKTSHRYLAALFQFDTGNSVLVIAAHLTARESKRAQSQRQQEFTMLNHALENMIENETDDHWSHLLSETLSQNRIVLCGDLNLHLPCETELIYQNGFHDIWLDIHMKKVNRIEDNELGYTWDPKQNSLINAMLPFDDRRMRLDRMLTKQGCNSFVCTDLQIFGDEPIGLCLYPSDHFGLIADFQFLKDGRDDCVIEHADIQDFTSLSNVTGFRSIGTIIAMRVVAVGMLPIAAFLFCVL